MYRVRYNSTTMRQFFDQLIQFNLLHDDFHLKAVSVSIICILVHQMVSLILCACSKTVGGIQYCVLCSREKTFANFTVSESFLQEIWGIVSFLPIRKSLLPRKFPTIQYQLLTWVKVHR